MFQSILKYMMDFYKTNKINICASYPNVFLNSTSGLVFNGEYFQQNATQFRDNINHDFEVYRSHGYRIMNKHFVQCWLKHELGIEPAYNNLILPIMDIGKEFFDEANKFLDKYQKDRPIALIQLKGGTSYFSPDKATCFTFQERQIRQSLAKTIVDLLLDSGYKVIRYGLPGEPSVKGTIQSNKVLDFRIWMAMCKLADKIICADSSLAHMAASQNKRALVLWGATNPANLGWPIHVNIVRSDWHCNGCGRPDTHFGDNPNWNCRFHGECSNHNEEIIKKEIEKYVIGR